jgi:hypothetical protein
MSDVMSETVVAPRGSRPVLGRYHVGNAVVDGRGGRVATERLVELRLEAEGLLTEAELLAGHPRTAPAPAQRMVR